MADNNTDNGVWIFVFFLLFVGGGGWLLWNGFKPQIKTAIVFTRSVQMNVAHVWTPDDKMIPVPMANRINDDGAYKATMGDDKRIAMVPMRFGDWRKFANNASADQVTNEHIQILSYMALRPYRIPVMVIIGLCFLWIIFNGPTSKFRRFLGLEELLGDQAKSFPVVRPFLTFNPNDLPVRAPGADVPADLPLFSEALGPEEWIAFNEIPLPDGNLDRDAAEAALAKQLGERWKGPMDLPAYMQVLLAAFCLKASRKRDDADNMLSRLACCWDHKGGLKLSRERGLVSAARKVLKDKKLSEKTLNNCNRHAYVTTALMRALDTAREEGGVLAPATFVWLRGHDRALWYPLNNVGRTAFHAEALGATSHYRAEKQVNRPIPRPRMGDAYDGMVEHLKNPLFARPIPVVDYSQSKRKKPGKNTGVMKPKAA